MEDEDLARYQAALLDALALGPDAALVLDALRADEALAPYREYAGAFEARLVETSAAMLARWGSHDDPERAAYERTRRPR